MTEQEIFDVVRRHLAEVLPDLDTARVQPDVSMRELGANSIDRMDLVIGVQDELGITVPNHELTSVHNLRSLVAAIQAHV
ncbi:phosphopantetheine-binding protein [Kutzneria chonburiensis]|uniref:Phosphopantetheine-binding protein n=1 Tax=Kutzneria chonburiensis TaxID=1483604 RepID=A0ABV6N6N2_9PSEU|nr:phosphopantetheine-binding protein [Kutzneria chonburiensis]HTI21473.1 phosphopantetheine-binding protein [Kutzneria sp.]